ncbi:MAG TPA: hypothetical protein PKI93_00135 [Alphaproteobacteria bacterium]|nr:hypothetical protein [Alphaproteobacteria bacterium]HNS43618.1 hypothetical protein [Alphaproteobacteria bacterium]
MRRKLALVAIVSVLLVPARSWAAGTNYNILPYYNPACNCCILVGQIMHEIFWGTGIWTGDDFQNDFYMDEMYTKKFLPTFQQMADQMRDAVITNAMMVGAFLDGQAENFALASVQKLNAKAIKDYQVSDQICRFGTVSRSLALSDDKTRTVKLALMEQVQNRQLMKNNMASGVAAGKGATIGRSADKKARWDQFKKKFCDKNDIGGTLSNPASPEKCAAASDVQQNRDIDMTRTLDAPANLELDFPTNAANLSNDEENVIALGNNLYAHNLAMNLSASDFNAMALKANDGQTRKLLDFRSVIAKRSVAANSFAAIAAMKAQGGPSSKTYLEALAKELGLANVKEIDALVGNNPSYNTQMEFLTKRMYQSPNFYANLYDTPANVEREETALGAIGLMQDRDIFESLQRSEMLLSTLLEIYVTREQDRYFNKGQK